MNLPEPSTEGHWCARCGVYRTRSVDGLRPVCADEEKHAEQQQERKAS